MRLLRRLRALLSPGLEADLEAEMRHHREMQRAAGLSEREADHAFGNELLLRERSRDAWGWTWLPALGRDLRYALRMLRRSPGFTVVAALSLALGIGANAAVYSMVDAVSLRALPVHQPDRLFALYWAAARWDPGNTWSTANFQDAAGRTVETSFSYPLYAQWRSGEAALADVAGFQFLSSLDVAEGNRAERLTGTIVTGNFDAVVGLTPALGRGIRDADGQPGAPLVAELSYALWQKRFGGDRGVLGRILEINGLSAQIVGVGQRGFEGLETGYAPDLTLPLGAITSTLGERLSLQPSLADAKFWFLQVVGRLHPGVTLAQARAGFGVAFAQAAGAIPQQAGAHGERPSLLVVPSGRGIDANARNIAFMLLLLRCFTGLVLLIAVVNLTNLLMARTAARRGELALRVAIGAGRGRLARQLLTEGVALATLGGVASLPLTWLAEAWIAALMPPQVVLPLYLDARVLAFTAVLALLAGVLLGVAIAWRAGRANPREGLKAAGPGAAAVPAAHRLSKILLGSQIAFCLVMLAGAGLFLRTLRNLQSVPTGFEAQDLVLFRLAPGLEGYRGAPLEAFYGNLLARLRALPGVTAAAFSDAPAGNSSDSTHSVALTAAAALDHNAAAVNLPIYLNIVAPGFFSTYRIPLLGGRDFAAGDTAAAPAVAIVNRALAARFRGNPIGQALYWGKLGPVRVVGIAADTRYRGVQEGTVPILYAPLAQHLDQAAGLSIAVRSRRGEAALAPEIRRAAAAVDTAVPVTDLETQREETATTYLPQQILAEVCGGLAAVSLLLAGIGLYGLMAFAVIQRTREIGIRLALGATRAGVARLVLRETLALAAGGTAVGLALALVAGRALRSLLFQVSSSDPATLIGAALFLAAVAALAAWGPVRRAARVDPMVALRWE